MRMTSTCPPMTAPTVSVIIPVYNEEQTLPLLFARLYPALDKLGIDYEILFINDGSRDRSAALLREQFQLRPEVTRVILFKRQFRPAHGNHGGIRALPRRPRRHARRRSAEPARGNRQFAGRDGPRPRLCRLGAHGAPGLRLPPPRLARDELAARAHHAHPHDRPGLHAARLRSHASSTRSIQPARSTLSSPRSPIPTRATRPKSRSPTKNAQRGDSKYSLYRLIRLNFDLVTGFSIVPLQVFSILGMFVAVMSVLVYIGVIIQRWIAADTMREGCSPCGTATFCSSS